MPPLRRCAFLGESTHIYGSLFLSLLKSKTRTGGYYSKKAQQRNKPLFYLPNYQPYKHTPTHLTTYLLTTYLLSYYLLITYLCLLASVALGVARPDSKRNGATH